MGHPIVVLWKPFLQTWWLWNKYASCMTLRLRSISFLILRLDKMVTSSQTPRQTFSSFFLILNWFFVLKWCNSNQNCCILKYKIRPILLCIKNILLKKIFYCHGNNICRRTLLNIEVVLKGIIGTVWKFKNLPSI